MFFIALHCPCLRTLGVPARDGRTSRGNITLEISEEGTASGTAMERGRCSGEGAHLYAFGMGLIGGLGTFSRTCYAQRQWLLQ